MIKRGHGRRLEMLSKGGKHDNQKDTKEKQEYRVVSQEGVRHADNRENLSSFSYTGSKHYKQDKGGEP